MVAIVASAARARRHPAFHPLAAALLAVLAWQPHALFSPGAQLSFAACGALVWVASRRRERDKNGEGRLQRWSDAAGASAAAAAATAPLAAWHWGTAAPFAVVVNLLAIPWTGMVLLPAALLATGVAALPEFGFGNGLIQIAAGLAAATLQAGDFLAALVPAAAGVRIHPLAIGAAMFVALLALRVRSALARAVLTTALGIGLWWAPPASVAPAPPRLVAFDVGRGDSVLLQGRPGAVLVDAGSAVRGRFDLGRSVVVPALRALGVEALDLLVATHADLDHRGGVPAVLRALPVGAVWVPFGAGAEPDFAELRAAALAAGVPVSEVGLGSEPVSVGDLRVTPLWPPSVSPDALRNERSLVLRVELGRQRVLLLGDLGAAEPALIATGAALRADVLLLPHHGSRGSSSAALLEAVAPRLAILSAGCPPVRGIPHPDALARASDANLSVWWTGRDGAVLVGLGERLLAAPFAPPRDCGYAVETLSVPSNASTSGRHTKRTGGSVTSASATDADTGW